MHSASTHAPGKSNPSSDPTAIYEVMSSCQCDLDTATRLLKQCHNNSEEARIRYDIEKLYGVLAAPTEMPLGQYNLAELSYDSSDDDLTLVMPSPGDITLPAPKLVGKRPPLPKKPQKLRGAGKPDNADGISQDQWPVLQPRSPVIPDQQQSQLPDSKPSENSGTSTVHEHFEASKSPRDQEVSPVDHYTPSPAIVTEDSLELDPFSAQGPELPVSDTNTAPPITSDLLEDHASQQPVSEKSIHNINDLTPLWEVAEDTVKKPEWDFILPEIQPPQILTPGVGEGNDGFSLRQVVGAVQHDADLRVVTEYLAYYDSDVVRRHLSDTLEGFPSIFFAVSTNNEAMIRLWIAFGADVAAVHESSGVPLLAFAIMNSEHLDTDTTLTVSTLLSLGAVPDVIPTCFYTPFIHDLPEHGPSDESLKANLSDKHMSWCTTAARSKLARTANITQRYYLERASKAKKPSSRHRQVAKLRNAEALLGISYFLIGQTMATNRLFQKLLTYMMVKTKRPLVMVFAGPSGHGKTELARRLGHLMGLDLEIVDCTTYTREIELFGPRNPYVGAEQGSPLNNFLVKNAGKRCIVFLDEFEKTTSDIHQALLVPFDNGEYQDRRDLKKIDCSKTVWILATNALDSTIQSFCKLHHKPIFEENDETEKLRLMKSLSKAIKENFLSHFGSPVTGRISDFIPFLPFSPGEQAVVVHKFLLELGDKVRGPVNLVPGSKEQLIGNVRMRIRKDASVCRILAQEEYHSDLGARSLIMGARKLEDLLVEVYLQVDEEIRESEKMVDFVVDVNGSEVIAKMVEQKVGEQTNVV
ncbi:Chaperone [Hyphodiscus hymeniophilus]|uniref:Chaperone n=1 Tax=Hyphodiscus hymeniophilus TaxID=353542 RepID=A0A9P6VCM7_9HELO|nr:Chaperone [Hyphodiscus hymeniophilus]